MKNCCQSGACIKPHYDWSEVKDDSMSGIEWAATILMILSISFAGTTILLMSRLHEATGRYF